MEGITMDMMVALFAGLALFLYGMKIMSDGLENVAGNRMKRIVELFTRTPLIGVFVGAFVTTIVQSSSASTVMVVGFVNAGIMNLSQAIGLIMGANIGTTITAQMVSFKLTALAPYAIAIGVGILLFSKNSKAKNYAAVILGFGLLFLGMSEMGSAMKPLRELQSFKDFILTISSPGIINTLLGLFVGFAFTAVVQSSSATTALLVTMASEGLVTIEAAFPMLLGANIGTCVTAMLSSIGASKTAKKAALMHLFFNVVGSVLFIILFIVFRGPAVDIMHSLGGDVKRQVANTHTVFNVVTTLLMLPFASWIVALVNKVMPTRAEDELSSKQLDDRMLETPIFALQAVQNEVTRMGNLALTSYKAAVDGFVSNNQKQVEETFRIERVINDMEKYIADFLIKLSNSSLSDEERIQVDNMFNTINDIERIGDHADNVAELAAHRIENKLQLSEHALNELKYMSERVEKSIEQSLVALSKTDKSLANSVIEREGEIDMLEKNLRKEHIKRLNENKCSAASGVIFLDVISNLERVGDHASNIALYVSDVD